jgi:methionyl-tRNA formyltransferase
MEKLRIVFMGTPEFAVGILDTIIKTTMIGSLLPPINLQVVKKLKYSAVKEYALINDYYNQQILRGIVLRN